MYSIGGWEPLSRCLAYVTGSAPQRLSLKTWVMGSLGIYSWPRDPRERSAWLKPLAGLLFGASAA